MYAINPTCARQMVNLSYAVYTVNPSWSFLQSVKNAIFCLQLCVRKIHQCYVQKSYSPPWFSSLGFSHADLLTLSHTASRCSHHRQGKIFTLAWFPPAYSTLLYRRLLESLSQHLALCTLALLLSRALILVLSVVVTDKTL